MVGDRRKSQETHEPSMLQEHTDKVAEANKSANTKQKSDAWKKQKYKQTKN